jgi:hypothetical protein
LSNAVLCCALWSVCFGLFNKSEVLSITIIYLAQSRGFGLLYFNSLVDYT